MLGGDEPVQLFRRPCGEFAFKPDHLDLRPEEMLIGRGITKTDAEDLIREFADAGMGRLHRRARYG